MNQEDNVDIQTLNKEVWESIRKLKKSLNSSKGAVEQFEFNSFRRAPVKKSNDQEQQTQHHQSEKIVQIQQIQKKEIISSQVQIAPLVDKDEERNFCQTSNNETIIETNMENLETEANEDKQEIILSNNTANEEDGDDFKENQQIQKQITNNNDFFKPKRQEPLNNIQSNVNEFRRKNNDQQQQQTNQYLEQIASLTKENDELKALIRKIRKENSHKLIELRKMQENQLQEIEVANNQQLAQVKDQYQKDLLSKEEELQALQLLLQSDIQVVPTQSQRDSRIIEDYENLIKQIKQQYQIEQQKVIQNCNERVEKFQREKQDLELIIQQKEEQIQSLQKISENSFIKQCSHINQDSKENIDFSNISINSIECVQRQNSKMQLTNNSSHARLRSSNNYGSSGNYEYYRNGNFNEGSYNYHAGQVINQQQPPLFFPHNIPQKHKIFNKKNALNTSSGSIQNTSCVNNSMSIGSSAAAVHVSSGCNLYGQQQQQQQQQQALPPYNQQIKSILSQNSSNVSLAKLIQTTNQSEEIASSQQTTYDWNNIGNMSMDGEEDGLQNSIKNLQSKIKLINNNKDFR